MKNLSLYLSFITVALFFSACSTTKVTKLECPDFTQTCNANKAHSKQKVKKKGSLTIFAKEKTIAVQTYSRYAPATTDRSLFAHQWFPHRRTAQKLSKKQKEKYAHSSKKHTLITQKRQAPKMVIATVNASINSITDFATFSEMEKGMIGTSQTPNFPTQSAKTESLTNTDKHLKRQEKRPKKSKEEKRRLAYKQSKKEKKRTDKIEKKLNRLHKIVEKKDQQKKEKTIQDSIEREPLGVISLTLSLLVLLWTIVSFLLESIIGSPITLLLALVAVPTAIILAIISATKVKKEPQKYTGMKLGNISLTLSVLTLISWAIIFFNIIQHF